MIPWQMFMTRAQAYVDRKYTNHADERQKALGLAYVEAERSDLAREFARFAASEINRRQSTITPALGATAEHEPIAWRIRVRERGGTTYHIYTERLPFEPDADSGIIAIGKAVPVFALDDIHWNEIRPAVTQQFEKTLEYLGKTEKE